MRSSGKNRILALGGQNPLTDGAVEKTGTFPPAKGLKG